MKFESQFNVTEEVYAFINNTPTKCIVRKIEFPAPSIWYSNYNNGCILYHLAPCKDLGNNLFNSHITDTLKYEREVGKTIKELCDKIMELSER